MNFFKYKLQITATVFGAVFLFLQALPVQALIIAIGGNVAKHELLVNKKNSEEEEERAAHFNSGIYVSPAIHLVTDPNYFGNSNFGWLVEFNFGGIDILQDSAILGSELYNDGRVTGLFGHLNPIAFIRFGDKHFLGPRNWSLSIGLGYGVSYIQLDGRFVTSHLPLEERELVKLNNKEGFFLLPATIIDYSWGNWFAKITSCFGGPGVNVDEYSYRVLFRSVGFGYAFEW